MWKCYNSGIKGGQSAQPSFVSQQWIIKAKHVSCYTFSSWVQLQLGFTEGLNSKDAFFSN